MSNLVSMSLERLLRDPWVKMDQDLTLESRKSTWQQSQDSTVGAGLGKGQSAMQPSEWKDGRWEMGDAAACFGRS